MIGLGERQASLFPTPFIPSGSFVSLPLHCLLKIQIKNSIPKSDFDLELRNEDIKISYPLSPFGQKQVPSIIGTCF